MPQGYGVPETEEGLLPWSWATARLEAALNYWFATTRPDGRPHAMPAWAVWLDDSLYFEGSPATRRARNLAENPQVSVHLESGDEVVILEGRAGTRPRPSVRSPSASPRRSLRSTGTPVGSTGRRRSSGIAAGCGSCSRSWPSAGASFPGT